MYKFIATTMAVSSLACAAEENDTSIYEHGLSPKAFYRYHNETGYKYKTWGPGLEYTLYRDHGMNLRINAITDTKKSTRLIESEYSMFYKTPFSENFTFYPIFSTRSSSHQVLREDHKDYYINKSSLFVGFGAEFLPSEPFTYRVEAQIFRDLHNAMFVQEKTSFWGKKYSNPAGFRAKIGISGEIDSSFYIDFEGQFAKTFENCYKEMGFELAFRWSI